MVRYYKTLRVGAVVVGLPAAAWLTIPQLDPTVSTWLIRILWLCLAIFAAEFGSSIWGCRDFRGLRKYLASAEAVVDILSVLPVPIAIAIGLPAPESWLFASLWILKLTKLVPGFSLLGRVIALEARPLATVLVVFLIVLTFASVALFSLEHSLQPDKFGSLPLALWWAVTTLTTTGYGDSVPQTFFGRLITAFVMICGLGVFGLWTGILATGFAAEHRRRDFMRNWELVTRVSLFEDLDPPAAIEITRMLRPIDIAEGTVIIKQGRPGDCMYFIADGEVEVRLKPTPVRLRAGDFFGELALLDSGPRTATVVTTKPSTLLVLEVADFKAFAAMNPQIGKSVQREAEARRVKIREMHEAYSETSKRAARW